LGVKPEQAQGGAPQKKVNGNGGGKKNCKVKPVQKNQGVEEKLEKGSRGG